MPEPITYNYVALDGAGRRVKGALSAANKDAALDALRARDLSALDIRPVRALTGGAGQGAGFRVADRDISAFVADLAALLRAGADIRTALSITTPKKGRPALQSLARQLGGEISGGMAVDEAFARHLPTRHAFIAALVSAGEASGDLPGGLERAAEMLEGQLQAKDRLVSILSYPLFVLISAIVGFVVILLLVIPSLAPLANTPGVEPGMAMRAMFAASRFIRESGPGLMIVGAILAIVGAAGMAFGVWGRVMDRLFLHGPFYKLAGALLYGGFAVALGGILTAGSPMSDALRLGIRATRSPAAQKALEPVLRSVRQGGMLSAALGEVRGFPESIVRLTVIGEQSGALGAMLVRAGRFEERAALRAIETAGRVIGPLMIVLLGALIGLLMAGLLSGVSGLGEAALQ